MTNRRTFITSAAAATAAAAFPMPALAYTPPKHLMPTKVRISSAYQPGEIVILPKAYFLYFVTGQREAIRYGIAVAKPGLGYTGTATIKRKVEWPTWRPTEEMIERDPGAYGRFKGNEERRAGGPRAPRRGWARPGGRRVHRRARQPRRRRGAAHRLHLPRPAAP